MKKTCVPNPVKSLNPVEVLKLEESQTCQSPRQTQLSKRSIVAREDLKSSGNQKNGQFDKSITYKSLKEFTTNKKKTNKAINFSQTVSNILKHRDHK